MAALNVGLLGYGNAGRVFHAPLIQAEPGLNLHRIGSRSFADKTLPPGVTGASVDDVIADPDINLIVVATPNDSHAPLALQALKAGKHVVVDKPFAVTADEATRLVQEAKSRNLLLSVFHNRRWDGGFRSVRQAVAEGLVGDISYGAFHFDRLSPAIKHRWREWQDVPGSGILHDLGPHLLDQILCLFGMPDALTASTARQRPGAQVDDFFHILLEYGSTRIAAHASSLMPDHGPRIALYGDQASLFQYGFDGQENALKQGAMPGDPGWGDTPGGAVRLIAHDGAVAELTMQPGQYEAYYADIAAAISQARTPEVTAQQALQVMQVLELARRSAETGQRQAV